ncbi:fructose-6-phosphate aldolase 2 [Flavobacteriales bacterium ALC-1]|nr:fructose-6-phosphate aldolase 2 [Flavobacteriales bacterium ALC-1]
MKFFIDTANLEQIKEAQDMGIFRWSYNKSIVNG